MDIAYDRAEDNITADTETLIAVTNEGVMPHDLAIDGTDLITDMLSPGTTGDLTVNLPAGEYIGYCTVPGHREAGMVITITAE